MSDNDRLPGAQRTLKIDAFPMGPYVWRIDWFGPVAFPDRAVRRRQPSVLVRLSKVSPEAYVEGLALHPQLTSDPSNRWVSVGTTMLLRIGDLWRNQSLFMEPPYDTELFEDIEVNDQTTSIIKAGSQEADESYVLPMQEHSWHSGNTQSYCVRERTGQGFDIVVPCMELARHYFGSSSELLSRLFLPPLERASLYEYKYFDADNGRLFVQLAERMPGTSAEDVARIAQCSQAWKAANMVGASCLRASVGGREFGCLGVSECRVKGPVGSVHPVSAGLAHARCPQPDAV
ncbi:MAG TPA: hypothetical protein H9903_09145 [Candidatus Aquabacterium excrementipullorum]|nr:hypothetical protein [Candidatus Aquabacterium excrementipullorum]